MSAEPQLPHTFFTMVEWSPVPKHHPGPVCTEFTVSYVVFFLKCPLKPHLEWDLLGIQFVNKEESSLLSDMVT